MGEGSRRYSTSRRPLDTLGPPFVRRVCNFLEVELEPSTFRYVGPRGGKKCGWPWRILEGMSWECNKRLQTEGKGCTKNNLRNYSPSMVGARRPGVWGGHIKECSKLAVSDRNMSHTGTFTFSNSHVTVKTYKLIFKIYLTWHIPNISTYQHEKN